MSFRLLRAGGAFARRFSRRDDVALLDPALAPLDAVAADPTLAVADVVAVEPLEKIYRATVSRTVTQTAVVEFAALEGTDTATLAQGLLETIPVESWVTQPADSWGYIDKIEEVAAADPLATLEDDLLIEEEEQLPPGTLARRRRRAALARRFARKGAYDVAVDGVYFATYEAATPADAVLAYVAEAGYATVDEAAAALGLTVEDFLLSVTASEALAALEDELPVEEEDEEALPPATMARRRAMGFSRRGRRSRKSTDYEIAAADAWAYLATLGWDAVEAQVPLFFGGASAEVDEPGMKINVYDESGILITALPYNDAIIIDLAVSMGYVSPTLLEDELPVEEEDEELPQATASRRRRAA